MPVGYDSWIQKFCPSPRRYFQALAVKTPCRRAVDLGCGRNTLLVPLRQRGVRCTGVDASEAALQECRLRDLFDEYVCMDVMEWLEREVGKAETWDVVVASHVIEHLRRDEGEKFLRLLEGLSPKLA